MAKSEFVSYRVGINKFWIEEAKIGTVEDYKYWGQTSKFNLNMEGIINKRITNAWKAFWINRTILKSKMKNKLKIKISDSYVIPVLTLNLVTYKKTISRSRKNSKLDSKEYLRYTLKRQDKNKIHFLKIGDKNIGYKIKKIKFNYTGHMARVNPEKWNVQSTFWTPWDYNRGKGRPANG